MAQRAASTELGKSASTASPTMLTMRPAWRDVRSSNTARYSASRWTVCSSSSATSLEYLTMSAARRAAILRFMVAQAPAQALSRSNLLLRPPPIFPPAPRSCPARTCGRKKARAPSRVGGALQRGLALQAIIAGEPADQLGVHPVLQDAAQVLARDTGHRGEVALAHLLADQDAAAADILAERLAEAEERARRPRLDRHRAHRQGGAVVAQPARQTIGA